MTPYIVYDIETRTWAEDHPRGWDEIPRFGLALAVTWDEQHGCRTWRDAAPLYEELIKYERIVSFNGIRFDNAVVANDAGRPKAELDARSFDILSRLTQQLGHRIKLEQLAVGLGRRKSTSGDRAVNWWKEFEQYQLSDPERAQRALENLDRYCNRDVEITRDVYQTALSSGQVRFENRGRVVTLSVNWE